MSVPDKQSFITFYLSYTPKLMFFIRILILKGIPAACLMLIFYNIKVSHVEYLQFSIIYTLSYASVNLGTTLPGQIILRFFHNSNLKGFYSANSRIILLLILLTCSVSSLLIMEFRMVYILFTVASFLSALEIYLQLAQKRYLFICILELLRVVPALILTTFFEFTNQGVFLCFFIGAIISVTVSIINRKYFTSGQCIECRHPRIRTILLYKYGLPVAAWSFIAQLFFNLDKTILKFFSSFYEANSLFFNRYYFTFDITTRIYTTFFAGYHTVLLPFMVNLPGNEKRDIQNFSYSLIAGISILILIMMYFVVAVHDIFQVNLFVIFLFICAQAIWNSCIIKQKAYELNLNTMRMLLYLIISFSFFALLCVAGIIVGYKYFQVIAIIAGFLVYLCLLVIYEKKQVKL